VRRHRNARPGSVSWSFGRQVHPQLPSEPPTTEMNPKLSSTFTSASTLSFEFPPSFFQPGLWCLTTSNPIFVRRCLVREGLRCKHWCGRHTGVAGTRV
jgi:hypothetical protein